MASLITEENRKWWTLAAVGFALFMIMLDNTVVNVALPAIQADLGVSLEQLEWIVTGYALSFAVLMLTGGKLADMYGRKLIFLLGLTLFTASSLACGLAPSAMFLIVARVVQGAGAAMMMPATLSIIVNAFPPQQRGTALGIWAGVSAVALSVGPLIGGLLTQHVAWNWIFFINIPVGIIGFLAAVAIIRESRDTSRQQRLDLPGLVSSGIAFFALVYALIEGNSFGWTSPTILALFGLAIVGFIAFAVLELSQKTPLFDMRLLTNGTFVGANIVAVLVSLAMFGMFFFISLFMQNILGYTAVGAGAAFLPMTLLITVAAPLAGRVVDRIGPRWVMTFGMLCLTGALFLLSRIDASTTFWTLLPALLLGGVGMASTMSPMTAAALSAVPQEKAGVGSGMLNTFRQVGGALGIALIGAILAAQAKSAAAIGLGPADAFVLGLQRALEICTVIALISALVSAALVRGHPRRPGGQPQAEAAGSAV